MLPRALSVISTIREQTDRVILFHSASGKDSIALLDLLYPVFGEVVCVYMYVIKDLDHINRYISYAQHKYPNVRFIQIPHYAVYSYIRTGYLGCEQNIKQKQFSLSKLTDIIREKTGIEWVCYGFKQSDGLNRRCMLRTYTDEAICEKSRKFFPLSTYKNGDILNYIEQKNLIKPEKYGTRGQSSGTDISDIDYLLYLREQFPQDLQKTFNQYPLTERLLFEYEYKNNSSQ